MTQLLVELELWTDLLDRGEAIEIFCLGFQKAFDSVRHKRQLTKSEAYDTKGRIRYTIARYHWLKS